MNPVGRTETHAIQFQGSGQMKVANRPLALRHDSHGTNGNFIVDVRGVHGFG